MPRNNPGFADRADVLVVCLGILQRDQLRNHNLGEVIRLVVMYRGLLGVVQVSM